MARLGLWDDKKFDAGRNFACRRSFQLFGRLYERSAPFDKSVLDQAPRKLKQLWEARIIGYAEDTPVIPARRTQVRAAPPAAPKKPRAARKRRNARVA